MNKKAFLDKDWATCWQSIDKPFGVNDVDIDIDLACCLCKENYIKGTSWMRWSTTMAVYRNADDATSTYTCCSCRIERL